MRRTALALTPAAFAISAPVQWVVSPGGSASVSATIRAAVTSGPSGGMREGRVLSRRRPVHAFLREALLPAPDAGLRLAGPAHDLVGANAIGAEQNDPARQTCFCGALRSLTTAIRRRRSAGETVMDIPVRMRQTRTAPKQRNPNQDSSVRQRPLDTQHVTCCRFIEPSLPSPADGLLLWHNGYRLMARRDPLGIRLIKWTPSERQDVGTGSRPR